MAKGEIQFTTIALLVITAVVLIGIIIWFLPSFQEAGSGLTDVGDNTGTADAITVIKCDDYCDTAQAKIDATGSNYCTDKDCYDSGTYKVACVGVADSGGDACDDGDYSADVAQEAIEAKCDAFCVTATALASTAWATSDYCTDTDCFDSVQEVSCAGVTSC